MAHQTLSPTRQNSSNADKSIYYSDGEIAIIDHVTDVATLCPVKPLTNVIALVCSGSIKFEANGQLQEAFVGNVLLCPPSMKVESTWCSDDFECKLLCLSDFVVQRLLRDKLDIWHQAVYVHQTNVIRMSDGCKEDFVFYDALIRSKTGANNSYAPSREIIHALVRLLLLELCSILEQFAGSEYEKVSQGKLLFNKYLNMISNNDVKRQPVALYASKLAITPKYLTMLCLKYSDKTASDWIVQYTVEDIRYYLKNTGLSIKEISAKLGFANMSHFGSYVRKHLGISPSDFRAQAYRDEKAKA
jgi:AraC-like DNA-binding protein